MNSLRLEGGCGIIEKVRGISDRGKKMKERNWGVKVQKTKVGCETDRPQRQPPASRLRRREGRRSSGLGAPGDDEAFGASNWPESALTRPEITAEATSKSGRIFDRLCTRFRAS